MQERRRCPGPPALRRGGKGRGAGPTMPQVSDLRPLSSLTVLRPPRRGSAFLFCPARLFDFSFFLCPVSGNLSNSNLKFGKALHCWSSTERSSRHAHSRATRADRPVPSWELLHTPTTPNKKKKERKEGREGGSQEGKKERTVWTGFSHAGGQ